jgi:hypothetical protein
VSPQREFSWILPSMDFLLLLLLLSPMDFYHVSSERIFMGLVLSGFFSFIFPSGFIPCLPKENFHGFCPQWLLFFYYPQWIFTMSPQREFSWVFALSGFFYFIFPSVFLPCLLIENFHGILPSVALSFSSLVDTVSPQRVLS